MGDGTSVSAAPTGIRANEDDIWIPTHRLPISQTGRVPLPSELMRHDMMHGMMRDMFNTASNTPSSQDIVMLEAFAEASSLETPTSTQTDTPSVLNTMMLQPRTNGTGPKDLTNTNAMSIDFLINKATTKSHVEDCTSGAAANIAINSPAAREPAFNIAQNSSTRGNEAKASATNITAATRSAATSASGSSPNYLPPMDFSHFSNEFVTFIAGKSQQKISIHKGILLRYPDFTFFHKELNNKNKESACAEIHMPGDSADVVGWMVWWCYHQCLQMVNIQALRPVTEGGPVVSSLPDPVPSLGETHSREFMVQYGCRPSQQLVLPMPPPINQVPWISQYPHRQEQRSSSKTPMASHRHGELSTPFAQYQIHRMHVCRSTSFEEDRLSLHDATQRPSTSVYNTPREVERIERLQSYLENYHDINLFAASPERIDAELIQLRLVKLIVFAVKYGLETLREEALISYCKGEKAIDRPVPLFGHIKIAYDGCAATSLFPMLLADYAYKSAARNGLWLKITEMFSLGCGNFTKAMMDRVQGRTPVRDTIDVYAAR
ncbi:hypothetical protein CkaCkLH20_08913 [Colletotrichum karsti]|uniref:BTB domain-containing protein n=1 Tax=Colletotrichum karsti TaxID=1095194 RepID=A0A9P6HZE5_9PEZI|nr:uncharacterized protein CkaCkLH20_08913 [Colletotrichum karsti]KAF9873454.1 hypothetical protein CkaCkLH20_08913 [Colletotrichum karsti]